MTERMTAIEFRSRRKGEKRPAGKNAQPVEVDGITFPSKKEARRWASLSTLAEFGEITDLRRQVRIELFGQRGPIRTPTGKPMVYIADFVYTDNDGETVIEDAKGHPSDVYLIKRAILAAMGVTVHEV